MKSSFLKLAAAVLVCVPTGLYLQSNAQDSPQSGGPAKPVLKTNTRLVVVDVVATDSEGHAISGLDAQDFSVAEDGRPQKISGFGFQQGGTKVTQVVLHLPPNVVSNIPQQKA